MKDVFAYGLGANPINSQNEVNNIAAKYSHLIPENTPYVILTEEQAKTCTLEDFFKIESRYSEANNRAKIFVKANDSDKLISQVKFNHESVSLMSLEPEKNNLLRLATKIEKKPGAQQLVQKIFLELQKEYPHISCEFYNYSVDNSIYINVQEGFSKNRETVDKFLTKLERYCNEEGLKRNAETMRRIQGDLFGKGEIENSTFTMLYNKSNPLQEYFKNAKIDLAEAGQLVEAEISFKSGRNLVEEAPKTTTGTIKPSNRPVNVTVVGTAEKNLQSTLSSTTASERDLITLNETTNKAERLQSTLSSASSSERDVAVLNEATNLNKARNVAGTLNGASKATEGLAGASKVTEVAAEAEETASKIRQAARVLMKIFR